jgi:hypothetical protein
VSLAATIERTRARIGFGARLAVASWTALAAVITVELGAIAERGLPHALAAGWMLGALLAAAALVLLVLGRTPTRREAAVRLDRALATGSLVETAAEAGEGRHGAFATLLVADAEKQLAAVELRRLVPIEPPRALGAGAAAALLLLALALGPAAETPPDDAAARPLEVAIEDEGAKGSEGVLPRDARRKLVLTKAGEARSGGQLDRAMAQALARELEDLARVLARRTNAAPGADAEKNVQDLERAVEKGDVAAVRGALRSLEVSGGAQEAARVARAADTLTGRRGAEELTSSGAAGAGSGASTRTVGGAGSGTDAGTAAADPGREARVSLPWRVLEAERRYREAIE